MLSFVLQMKQISHWISAQAPKIRKGQNQSPNQLAELTYMCFFIILSPKRKHDGHVGLLALSVERIFQDICFTSEIVPLRVWCQVLD